MTARFLGTWGARSTDLVPSRKDDSMSTGQTGFDDVTFDLISVQYHALKAGHDYGQYVRDAQNAGVDEIAAFFEEVRTQDAERAHRAHELLARPLARIFTGSSRAEFRKWAVAATGCSALVFLFWRELATRGFFALGISCADSIDMRVVRPN